MFENYTKAVLFTGRFLCLKEFCYFNLKTFDNFLNIASHLLCYIEAMNKILRKIFFISTLFLVGFFLFFDFGREIFSAFNFTSSFVVFFDVGQGDSALIRTPTGKNILIDAGADNLTLERLGEFLPYFSRRLDYVIVSHYHDDHIGALREIFRRFSVINFIYQTDGEIPKNFKELLLEISQTNGINLVALERDAQINFNANCKIYILNPLILSVPKDGNNSLILQLNCVNKKFLFSGDNELAVEKALLKSGLNLQSDVFKASHHGSKTSNSEEFLKMIDPDYIIISAGRNNRFNHPAEVVLERAQKANIKIKRTDLEGNIEFLLNN